jgi:uncharacterized protein (DUF58 family)
MTPKSFRIAKWFVVANYLTIAGSFIIALLFVVTVVLASDLISRWQVLIFVIGAVGFVIGGIYSINILPRLKATVYVSEKQISYELADGDSVSISWEEDFEVRNRPFLGRLELISQDGQRVVQLEQQLSKYDDLLGLIDAKIRAKQGTT